MWELHDRLSASCETKAVNENSDRWDRVLAFHRSGKSRILFCLLAAFIVFWDNTAWTIPLKVVVLVIAASYWITVGAKSVHGFRAGYRDRN